MTYLDFEKPIQELETEVFKLKEIASKSKVNLDDKIKELESNIKAKTAEIYNNLNAWQRVQVSRHPERPYTLAYINAISNNTFIELHGDRTVGDDKAMVGGFGDIDGRTVMFMLLIYSVLIINFNRSNLSKTDVFLTSYNKNDLN